MPGTYVGRMPLSWCDMVGTNKEKGEQGWVALARWPWKCVPRATPVG